MPIKSLEDLKQIREEHLKRVGMRTRGESIDNETEILVGMATCGISSGARETLNAFVDELRNMNIDNVRVVPVGCIGSCHSEPTVQVIMSGKEPVLYGKVTKDKVHEIIEQHIKGGQPVENMILKADFERA
jgi:NADP-reducing hydrogenase subunit HndB